jgi:putative ABC transport system substrate-binding protein
VPGRVAAFTLGLQHTGWIIGRNVEVEYRWGAADADRYRKYAAELVMLAPDAIVGHGGAIAGALQHASRTIPIVFVNVTDPVAVGLVTSLARPGGNTTGFISQEFSTAGKWLELLKEMAPQLKRVAVLRDPGIPNALGQYAAIQSVASVTGVETTAIIAHDASEVERAITEFASGSNCGLIAPATALSVRHRKLIIALAARLNFPAIYPDRFFVAESGLMSFGPDLSNQYGRAAGYVDRILKGEKPSDLPVQVPTKYELAINLSTAKALGLTVPPTLLARADEVIE